MRHRKQAVKLGRSAEHRQALLASLASHLIERRRVRTTLQKARLLRRYAERLITLVRRAGGDSGRQLAARRRAVALLGGKPGPAKVLFTNLAPRFEGRAGGYTRVLKLDQRPGDGAQMALVEWVGIDIPVRKRREKKNEESKPAA
jgi:large subunit ribosomal protein L17